MLTTAPVSAGAPAPLFALVPPIGGPHTSTTTMAVSELRAVGFTDADIGRHLGVPDMVGPRGGRRYNRARAALVVARRPQMLSSYAGRHGWWSSLKLLGEGLAVPVPYAEMVIVPRTGLAAGTREATAPVGRGDGFHRRSGHLSDELCSTSAGTTCRPSSDTGWITSRSRSTPQCPTSCCPRG